MLAFKMVFFCVNITTLFSYWKTHVSLLVNLWFHLWIPGSSLCFWLLTLSRCFSISTPYWSFLYLNLSRLDITYVVHKIIQYVVQPLTWYLFITYLNTWNLPRPKDFLFCLIFDSPQSLFVMNIGLLVPKLDDKRFLHLHLGFFSLLEIQEAIHHIALFSRRWISCSSRY